MSILAILSPSETKFLSIQGTMFPTIVVDGIRRGRRGRNLEMEKDTYPGLAGNSRASPTASTKQHLTHL